MSLSSPVADGSGFGKLYLFPPKDVAVELSLMDGELLRKVSPDEIKNGAWMDKCKTELAPNVLAMVQSFNRLALLVPTEVLEERTPQTRSKVITAFIQIANKCYCLHNYNSLKAIIAGLQCTPIHRLKKTWKEVPSKRRKQFKELSSVVSEDRNWETYCRELHQQLSTNTPFIPFLGVFLTQIVQRESYEKMRPKEENIHRQATIFETYTILDAITARNKLDSFMHMRMRSFDIESPASSDSEESVLERNGVHDGNGSTCPLVSLLFQSDEEQSSPNGICSSYTQCSVNQQPAFIPKLKQKLPPIREASPCENQLLNKRKEFAAMRLVKSISAECLIDVLQEPVLKASSSLHDIDSLSCSDEDDLELETPIDPAMFDTTQSLPVSYIHQSKSPCPPGTRRRSTAAVHKLFAAQTVESSKASPPDMLAKYQFMSLGLSSGCESRPELRTLLTNYMSNSEGLNYKLSYEREPE